MIAIRAAWAPLLLAGLVAAGLTALPVAAVAADGPIVEDSNGTIAYVDPALVRERTTTVEGTLRVVYADRIDRAGRPSVEMAYAVETDGGETVPVDIADDLPERAANGDIEAEVVDAGSDDAQVAAATVEPAAVEAAAPAGAAHRAYVVLVPKTGTMPSEADAAARINSNVLSEWVDESDGAISSFSVADTATLATNVPTTYSRSELCRMTVNSMQSSGGLWSEGAKKFPGVDFSSGVNHLIMLTSSDCTSGSHGIGIGTVGTGIDDGGLSTVLWDSRYFDATTIHELGHNFGLGHANVEGAEYYDLYSVMGFGTPNGGAPALDSLFRDKLGIEAADELARPQVGSVTTYDLAARGLESGLRGLVVDDPSSHDTYWVDYRTGAGRDAGSTFAARPTFSAQGLSYAPGVVVYHRASDYGSSHAIDVLKRETGRTDATSWGDGQTFVSPSGAVSIEVQTTSATSAQVKVVVDGNTFQAGKPRISGVLRVGETLTAEEGGFVPTPETYRYQWYWRGNRAIPGATKRTFTITSGYLGEQLRVRITGDSEGFTPKNAITGSSRTIGAGVFSAASPSVGGEARVGANLQAVVARYSPKPSYYRYQWYSGSSAIRGATSSRYRVSSAYQGKKLRVRVTGVKSGFVSKNTISGYTSTVLPTGRFSASAPKISGTLQVGKTVTAQVGSHSPAPSSYRYQWYWKGSKPIRGATSQSFKISAGYKGQRLRVRVTAVRSGFTSKNTITGNSAKVAPGQFSASSPSVSGQAAVGATLRAVVSAYSPKPSSYRYQWYSGSSAIRGATSSTYRVSSAYRGKQLRVRVTGLRFGYTSKNTISGYTEPVS